MTPMLISPTQAAASLAASCISLILLAVAASPAIAVTSQQLAIRQKKNFYDKLARQVASMATTLGCIFFTGIAAASIHTAVQNPEMFQGPFRMPLMVCIGTVAFSFAALMAYTASWKILRQSKGLHMLIGMFASILMISAVFLISGLTNSMTMEGHVLSATDTPLQIFITVYTVAPTSLMWPIFLQTLLGGLGAAGMLAQGYLLLRRNRDDFGRDYYKFAVPYCAKWAIIPTLLQLIPAAWLFTMLMPSFGTPELINPALWCWIAAGALPLLSCFLWMRVLRSETPLRHKASIILAIPIMIVAVMAEILTVIQQLGY